jgi:2-polyprenyl-6-methoxyphenol hydroxylase-like FAD-dependent oxidoreductase
MAERFDVIVVGARVAGASLATHLARRGLEVCLLDQARFPSDTLSTHIFQNLPALERLGVLDRLLETGAPLLTEVCFVMDDLSMTGAYSDLPMLCVRRTPLDQILLDNAVRAGPEVRTRTRVTELVNEDGRVCGVRTSNGDGLSSELHAPVVVGADGRSSTVASLVGARRYNVTENELAGGWAYYEGSNVLTPTAYFCRLGERLFAACPTDGGLYIVISIAPKSAFGAMREGDGAGFDRSVEHCLPLAPILAGARRVARPTLIARWQGYFRESAGPGWALVGDAGHFKDPTPGQGISDALRQAEHLAEFIPGDAGMGALDDRLAAYWRWRDEDAAEKYWWAQDMGRAAAPSPLVKEMFRGISGDPKAARAFYEVFFHRRPPSKAMTPARLLGACGRLLLRGDGNRREVLAEARSMIQLGRARQRLNKRPQFEEGDGGRRPDDELLAVSA